MARGGHGSSGGGTHSGGSHSSGSHSTPTPSPRPGPAEPKVDLSKPGKPAGGAPDGGKPSSGKPDSPAPTGGKPDDHRSDDHKPGDQTSDGRKSDGTKPDEKKPDDKKKPAEKNPEDKRKSQGDSGGGNDGGHSGAGKPDAGKSNGEQAGGGGFCRSDEVCDQHGDKLTGFATWIPIYNSYTGQSIDLKRDIYAQYDQVREIDFCALEKVAAALHEAGRAYDGECQDVNTQVGKQTGHWTGSGADAFGSYIQKFETAAQVVDRDIAAVAKAVQDSSAAVRQVVTVYGKTIDQLNWDFAIDPPIAELLITFAKAEKSIEDVLKAACAELGKLIGCVLPIPDALAGAIGDFIGEILDFLGMSEMGVQKLFADAARAFLDAAVKQPFEHNRELLRGAFTAGVDGTKRGFQPMIDAANGINKDPFGGLRTAPQGGGQTGRGRGGGQGGGGGTGGGGAQGGGGGQPPMQPLGTSQQSASSPAPPPPPVRTPPMQVPAQQETVTINAGNGTILSVASGTGPGPVRLTVNNGRGPQTYDIDFGGAGTARPGQPGPGGPGLAGTPGQPNRPGPDGRVVIHDGPVTIIAQRPGGPGSPISFTVDNGTGRPESFGVAFNGPPGNGPPGNGVPGNAAGGAALPGQPGGLVGHGGPVPPYGMAPAGYGPPPGGPQPGAIGSMPAAGIGGPQHYAPQQFGPQQFGPQQFGPQQFAPQQAGSPQFGPQQFGPQHAGPQHPGPQQYGPHGGPQSFGPQPGGAPHPGPPGWNSAPTGPPTGGFHPPQPSAPQPSAPQPSAPQPSAPQPSAPQPSAPQLPAHQPTPPYHAPVPNQPVAAPPTAPAPVAGPLGDGSAPSHQPDGYAPQPTFGHGGPPGGISAGQHGGFADGPVSTGAASAGFPANPGADINRAQLERVAGAIADADPAAPSGPGAPEHPAQAAGPGLPPGAQLDTSTPQVNGAGHATFGSLHDAGDQPAQPPGGMTMGGMATVTGSAGGGDIQRGPSQWRVPGQYLDSEQPRRPAPGDQNRGRR